MKKRKVIRVLVLEGEADWIDATLEQSQVRPDKPFDLGFSKITEILREEVIFNDGESTPDTAS